MSFEEIKNFSLLCVLIWVIYKLIWKSKDQERGQWDAFASVGIAAAALFCYAILNFAMGGCGSASWEDLFLLRARNKVFCSVTLELNYTIIAALVLAALWNGAATLHRFLKRNR